MKRLDFMAHGGRPAVVGESHCQPELNDLVDDYALARDKNAYDLEDDDGRVRIPVKIDLRAEPSNEYDPNAISAWIGEVRVGYLKRQHCVRYKADLAKLGGVSTGHRGVIVGRDGNYGVFFD
jgi:hypothetical protein